MLARGYKDPLTYWAPLSTNAYGEETFESPVLLYGRWENRQEEAKTPSAEIFVSKAVVFVQTDLEYNGYIVEGDFTSVASPSLAGAERIQASTRIPSMRTNSAEKRYYV